MPTLNWIISGMFQYIKSIEKIAKLSFQVCDHFTFCVRFVSSAYKIKNQHCFEKVKAMVHMFIYWTHIHVLNASFAKCSLTKYETYRTYCWQDGITHHEKYGNLRNFFFVSNTTTVSYASGYYRKRITTTVLVNQSTYYYKSRSSDDMSRYTALHVNPWNTDFLRPPLQTERDLRIQP